MDFNAWWYDYKIKNGLLSHVDRYKPHVQAAWDAAQAARGDVSRQQIAWVVIRDYDYEGDTLAGVHPTMEDAERQAEWMRKELGETRVEQWQMGEMEEMFTPPSNSLRGL